MPDTSPKDPHGLRPGPPAADAQSSAAQPGSPGLVLVRRLLIFFGLAAGVGATTAHVRLNEFPIDMIIYREGVRAFLEGGAAYTEPMHAGDVALPFIYPPFGALALAPLSPRWIPDAVAGDIMIVVSSALLLTCLYFTLRAVAGRGRWLWPLVAVAWPLGLAVEPVVLNDSFAQINTALMALVVLDLVPRKRRLPQGWLIGLAVAVKISPAAMLLYFLLKRRIGPIVTAAATALAATAVAAAIRWDQTRVFFTDVLVGMGADSEFGVDSTYTSNSSLKGMIMRFSPTRAWLEAHGTAVNLIWVLCVLAVIGFGAWLMLRLLRDGRDTEAWLINALVMLLISPISWSHHWVWLALLFPVLAHRVFGAARMPRWTAAIAAVWLALVLTMPPKWWFGDGVEFEDLNFLATFLVSDFVWLALALMVAVALERPAARPR